MNNETEKREYEDAQKSLTQETPDGYYDVKIVSIQEGDRYYEVAAKINDGEYEGQRVKGRLYKTERAEWAIDRMKVSCGLYAEDDIAECINKIGRAKCGTDKNGYTNQIICWVNRANWAKTKPVKTPIWETQETPATKTNTDSTTNGDWEKRLAGAIVTGNKELAAAIIREQGLTPPGFLIDEKTEEPVEAKEATQKNDVPDEFVLFGDEKTTPANDEPEEQSFSQNIDVDKDGAIVDPDTKWHERPTQDNNNDEDDDLVLDDPLDDLFLDEQDELRFIEKYGQEAYDKMMQKKELKKSLDKDNEQFENEGHNYYVKQAMEVDDLPF